jgi:hypothetical protein
LRDYWEETVAALLCDAADRIETLEAALREIADCYTLPAQNDYEMREIARAALKGETDD